MYKKIVKRILDVLLSLLALIIFSPFILLIALFVKIFMGSVIFKQERTGKDGKTFYIYKFKTMKDLRDENGELLPNDQRRSKFGDILRSTSLDELPELWNILVGDMSIIGPRPLFKSYLPYYKEEEKARNSVRGGLIPPEMVSLNLTPTWDEQLALEADYAANLTFFRDIRIFLCTFVVIFKRIFKHYGNYDRKPLDVERSEIKTMQEVKATDE